MITVRNMRKIEAGNVKAFFDVTINGVEVKGLKLVVSQKDGNLFLSFPSEKGKDGKYYNIVYISDMNLKNEVEKYLVETYNNNQGKEPEANAERF
jgi:DNA-binding cell septation regulator SpoVG